MCSNKRPSSMKRKKVKLNPAIGRPSTVKYYCIPAMERRLPVEFDRQTVVTSSIDGAIDASVRNPPCTYEEVLSLTTALVPNTGEKSPTPLVSRPSDWLCPCRCRHCIWGWHHAQAAHQYRDLSSLGLPLSRLPPLSTSICILLLPHLQSAVLPPIPPYGSHDDHHLFGTPTGCDAERKGGAAKRHRNYTAT